MQRLKVSISLGRVHNRFRRVHMVRDEAHNYATQLEFSCSSCSKCSIDCASEPIGGLRSGSARYDVLHWDENDASDGPAVDGVTVDIDDLVSVERCDTLSMCDGLPSAREAHREPWAGGLRATPTTCRSCDVTRTCDSLNDE
eukprot:m.984388 g.984388  ORF g.984388 m.984388 type:complete len:142 (+) comp23979_c0_seq2:319-744(+)